MHDHAPAAGVRGYSNRRLLTISLSLTGTVLIVQVVGAILTGSLALLADAVHMFADTAALVIALVASVIAARPANERNTYGYQRAEVFGALINACLLLVLCGWIVFEGITRLVRPESGQIDGSLMLVVAAVGLVANAVSMYLLSRAQRSSINVRGAYLEVMADLIGSAMVIVAAILLLATGWQWVDAAASLVIAAMIAPRSFVLLREVFVVLGESAPRDTDVTEIREHLLDNADVVAVHDVHVWQLTRGSAVFTAHVVVTEPALEEGRSAEVLGRLESCLVDHFDVAHSTFQLEPAGQVPRCHVAHD